MARALRHISVERGYDPAEFTLLSFGGAGGLHACALADALSMRSLLIPRFPGAFSALGLTLADVKREYVQSLPAGTILNHRDTETRRIHGEKPEEKESLSLHPIPYTLHPFAALEARAEEEMRVEGYEPGTWQGARMLDLRYVGQSFDLRVPIYGEDVASALAAFHAAHQARYGHADPREPVEAVGVRLIAVGPVERPRLVPELPAVSGQPIGETNVHFEEGAQRTALYRREDLAADQRIPGPALILQTDATTLLAPDWHARTDASGNLRLHRE
jgi:N-methylhydantoinase A